MSKRRLLGALGLTLSVLFVLAGIGGVLLFALAKDTVCVAEDGSSIYGEAKVQLLPLSYTCDWTSVVRDLNLTDPTDTAKFDTSAHYLISPYVIIAGSIGVYVFSRSLRNGRH